MTNVNTIVNNIGEFEILGPGYSTHPVKIVNTYIANPNYKDGCIKISYYEDEDHTGNELYFYYNRLNGEQPYKSRNYLEGEGLPEKYLDVVKELKTKYAETFNTNQNGYLCPNCLNIIGSEDRKEVNTIKGKGFSCNLCQHVFTSD